MIKRQEPEKPAWAKYITEDNLPTEDLQYLCSIIGLEATKKLMFKATGEKFSIHAHCIMYGSKFGAIKADFEKYVNDVTKKLVEKFSSKDSRNIDPKYLFEAAKKSDLYNQFSEMGIGWLSQIEKSQKQNLKDLILK